MVTRVPNTELLAVRDQFGIKSVAQEIIDAKLAQEQMQEIATMVDMRFGHGTWRSIVDERAKRIREDGLIDTLIPGKGGLGIT